MSKRQRMHKVEPTKEGDLTIKLGKVKVRKRYGINPATKIIPTRKRKTSRSSEKVTLHKEV